jgi:hypothetical protein
VRGGGGASVVEVVVDLLDDVLAGALDVDADAARRPDACRPLPSHAPSSDAAVIATTAHASARDLTETRSR